MNLFELLCVTDEFRQYTQNKIDFDSNGWPIFKKEHFLDKWPSDMITFEHRTNKLVSPESETLLCFYMSDVQNFRRFRKIQDDLPIYKHYLGVVVPDVTITRDMDNEMQEMMMLANQLFAAVLVANNIKIVFNTRSGNSSISYHFGNIPRNVMCASGFLGCKNSKDVVSASPYINKILGLMPEKLVIYGKHDVVIDEQLDLLGFEYRYYSDFHTRSKISSYLQTERSGE